MISTKTITNAVKTTIPRSRGRPRGKYPGKYNYKDGARKPGRQKVELTPEIIEKRKEAQMAAKKRYNEKKKLERAKIREARKIQKQAEKQAEKERKKHEKQAEKEKKLKARLTMNLRKKAVASELNENPALVNILWALTQKYKTGEIEIELRDGSILKNIKFSNKSDPNLKNEEQIDKEISADIAKLTKEPRLTDL